jgi:hypothetical protein
MATPLRRKKLYPGVALEKAREAVQGIAAQKVGFSSHALGEKTCNERRIKLSDIRTGIMNPKALINPNRTRRIPDMDVFSYCIETDIEGYDFDIIIYFYYPKDSHEPDVMTILTAYFPNEPGGVKPGELP